MAGMFRTYLGLKSSQMRTRVVMSTIDPRDEEYEPEDMDDKNAS